MSVPKCLFFQDLEVLTEVFGRMSAGMSGPKLPLWAEFLFLIFPWKKKTGQKIHQKNPRQNSNQNLGVSCPKSTLQGSGLHLNFILGVPNRHFGTILLGDFWGQWMAHSELALLPVPT